MKYLRSTHSSHLLKRILNDPDLPERIRAMDPPKLARMIQEIGLEDCGEIVALASAQQIERVFDEDLWKASSPGTDESFDPSRFGLWIEILLELGASFAAKKIIEMDPDFLTMAFSQLIWVIEFSTLQTEFVSESRLEKIMDSTSYFEIEDFILFSRDPLTWDAMIALIVELDRNHHNELRNILERCAYFSSEQMQDEGGIFTVLTSEEQLKEDVAYEREKRREALGYVTPADARAFLKLASGPNEAEDHVSPKKFRGVMMHPSTTQEELNQSSRSLIQQADHRFKRIQALLSEDLAEDLNIRQLKMEELNYLANVLVSGGDVSGRAPRPGEAALMVLEACEKGLQQNSEIKSLIEAFRWGWPKRNRISGPLR